MRKSWEWRDSFSNFSYILFQILVTRGLTSQKSWKGLFGNEEMMRMEGFFPNVSYISGFLWGQIKSNRKVK